MEDENPEEKARKHKELEVSSLIHVLFFTQNVVLQPSPHYMYFCLKLKPLYKELLYTIAHKMGNPSSTQVFTDSQLHQYIKEVHASPSHITRPITLLLLLVYD